MTDCIQQGRIYMQFIRPADLIYSIPVLGSGIFSCCRQSSGFFLLPALTRMLSSLDFRYTQRILVLKKKVLNYTFKLSISQYICVIVSDDVN